MATKPRKESEEAAGSLVHPPANADREKRPKQTERTGLETLAAIRDTAEIPAHLAFIDEILRRYPMRSERNQEFASDLARLKQRFEDPNVYLGVIGEFSAGKTTLINALVGDDLLRTDILQGTTSAATLLRFGPSLDAEVQMTNGCHERFSRRKGAAISRVLTWLRSWFVRDPGRTYRMLVEWIHRYSSREADSQQVTRVTIEHPAPVLKDGLAIVDTPGLNAENQRHVAVTLTAIRDICDAFIVALPATAAGSELLISFLRTHLSGALHRCVFVITKVDLLRNPAEEERVRRNVQARLAAELELSPPPPVFSCAPEIALNFLQGKDPNAGRTRVLAEESLGAISVQFDTVSRQLLQAVRRYRFLLVLENITVSLGDLLTRTEKYLGQCQQACRARHTALQKHRIPDFDSFIHERKSRLGDRFRAEVSSLHTEADGWLATSKVQLLEVLRSTVFAAPDRRSLKKELSTVPSRLINRLQELVELKFRELTGRLTVAARVQQETFEAEFRNLYEKLATLGGELPTGSMSFGGSAALDKQTIDAAKGAAWQITAQAFADNAKIGGGAFAGGAIGVAIAGPLGAIVGAAGGFLIGKLFGKSIAEVQESSFDRLSAVIDQTFESISGEFHTRLGSLADQAEQHLISAIDMYRQHYIALVSRMIERDRAERDRVARLHNQASIDRRELTNRNRLLKQIQEECVTIQKTEATG